MKYSNLSECDVVLSRPHNGPGVKVHLASKGEFLTLKSAPFIDLTLIDKKNDDVEQNDVRIVIGNREHGLLIPISFNGEETLISNFWVYEGEEVWVSVRHPNQRVVYGFVTSNPLV